MFAECDRDYEDRDNVTEAYDVYPRSIDLVVYAIDRAESEDSDTNMNSDPPEETEYSTENVAIWKPSDISNSEVGHFEVCSEDLSGKFGEYFHLVALATALTIECTNNRRLCNQGRSSSAASDGTAVHGSVGGMGLG